jgi:hypothetical protein
VSVFSLNTQDDNHNWRSTAQRLRFFIKAPGSIRFGQPRGRQFPEPNKGFDIAKIAKVIAGHVDVAQEHATVERAEANSRNAGRQRLWRLIRAFGLPEDRQENYAVGHPVDETLVEQHASMLPRAYTAEGERGKLQLSVSEFSGEVTGTVTISATATTEEEIHKLIARLTAFAEVDHHVCDRDELAAERKAKFEAEQKEAQA